MSPHKTLIAPVASAAPAVIGAPDDPFAETVRLSRPSRVSRVSGLSGLSGLSRPTIEVPDRRHFERLPITPAPAFESARALHLVSVPAHSLCSGRASQRVTSPVRLTRRGRIAVLVLLALLALLATTLGFVLSSGSAAAGGPGAAVGSSIVVVQPGDTLWSIAARANPNADPRVLVQRIIDVNALPGADVQPGQELSLPS
jgi:hypothetical protein